MLQWFYKKKILVSSKIEDSLFHDQLLLVYVWGIHGILGFYIFNFGAI